MAIILSSSYFQNDNIGPYGSNDCLALSTAIFKSGTSFACILHPQWRQYNFCACASNHYLGRLASTPAAACLIPGDCRQGRHHVLHHIAVRTPTTPRASCHQGWRGVLIWEKCTSRFWYVLLTEIIKNKILIIIKSICQWISFIKYILQTIKILYLTLENTKNLSKNCAYLDITFLPCTGKKKPAMLRELEEFRSRPIRDAAFGKQQDAPFLLILTEGKSNPCSWASLTWEIKILSYDVENSRILEISWTYIQIGLSLSWLKICI